MVNRMVNGLILEEGRLIVILLTLRWRGPINGAARHNKPKTAIKRMTKALREVESRINTSSRNSLSQAK
jgi:hypothetical protein